MATVIERFYGELSKKLLGRSVGEGLGSTGKGMRRNREEEEQGGPRRSKEEGGGRRVEEKEAKEKSIYLMCVASNL